MICIMKKQIAFLPVLACLCSMAPARASDCIGDGCDIQPMMRATGAPTNIDMLVMPAADCTGDMAPAVMPMPAPAQYNNVPMAYDYAPVAPAPMALVPVQDGVVPAWDGTYGHYQQRRFDKTVDWRDGVPIWDDSISHYRERDFSDWYTPMDIYYYSDRADFVTRDAVENLLTPMRPTSNLWTEIPEKYAPQDMDCVVAATFDEPVVTETQTTAAVIRPIPVVAVDGCPFETSAECDIWRKKPMIRETVSPRSPQLRATKMDAFINAAQCDAKISANDPVAAPLLARYKMLMQSAQACCTDGMVYALKNAGASDALVYKFMADDANFYNLGARCLMTTDAELDSKYPNTATAAVAADVRNGCLCRGRQWFTAMLAPFQAAYTAAPEFAAQDFWYTYTDGLQREITVSVNTDIKNVLDQLSRCP